MKEFVIVQLILLPRYPLPNKIASPALLSSRRPPVLLLA